MTTDLTITDRRVAEMPAAAVADPPDEVMIAFGREQAELATAGLPAGIAAVGAIVADQLGILAGPSAGALAAQFQIGLDLTAVNADATTALPMPTTMILDAEPALRWIDVHPDYSTRTEVQ